MQGGIKVKEEKMISDFLELTALPVHSRDERQIADAVKEKLEALGLTVSEEEGVKEKVGGNTGNIRAVLAGDDRFPAILFSAHLDRVQNNGHIQAVYDEEEGCFRADGNTILAADDVAGICTILEALRQITASDKPHGMVEVALSVCEEAGVLGSRHFDFDSFRSRMAYVFDAPGRIGRLILQAPSKCKLTYKIHGKSAHAGNEPEKGINAVRAAATLIMELPDSRLTPCTTANISTVHGGGATTNVVCDYAEVLAEVRSTDQEEFLQTLKQCRQAAETVEKQYGVKIEYDENIMYHTFKVEPDAPVVQIAAKAMKKLGIEPVYDRGGGGMDGNHFNCHGIAAIGVAPGYSKNHTPNEYLYKDDFLTCGSLAAELVWAAAESE